MNDVGVLYRGGSGGCFLFHLLLLSDNYFSYFDIDIPGASYSNKIKIINNRQFNNTVLNWKDFEFWPDNKKTFENTSILNKLYLGCNWHQSSWEYPNIKKVLLYVDLPTQLRQAYYKGAVPYNNTSTTDSDIQLTLREFQTSERYKGDIVFGPASFEYIDNSKPAHGFTVLANIADVVINLRDLINSPQESLVLIDDRLVLNNKQEEFIARWKGLHSRKQRAELNLW